MTATTSLGIAAHTSALYVASSDDWLVVHDTSRHVSVAKLIGMAALRGTPFSDSVAVTTGRASSDMVVRLARVGVPIIITLRGPLYSGVKAALSTGVTLISNTRVPGKGREFRVISAPHRIIG